MPEDRPPRGSGEPGRLDPAQQGVGDMDPDAFRVHGHAVVDWIADYLARVGDLPVLARVEPGEVAAALPDTPPEGPEPFDHILADLDRVVLPGITHWNHPAFHGWFAITGSGPGVLGEAVSAALNVNAMLWRAAPAATELEEVALDWLRQLMGLPAGLRGVIMDTASMATLVALAAAREAAGLDVRRQGLAGRTDLPALRVYTSEQAHSSVDKAAITLGIGHDGVRHVAVDDAWRMDPGALAEAIEEDVGAGHRPLAIVATTGTTATTSVDPLAAVADVRDEAKARHGLDSLWLHVDAAYGGLAAVVEEGRWVLEDAHRAESLVTNPHKWLFTPIDCSALYVREPDALTRAFSLVPDYLRTPERGRVTDYMDWGVQLGRRFRALKLWMVLRYFGAEGVRRRIRTHLELARRVASWVDDHPLLERAAPTPLTTVCLRLRPTGVDDPGELDRLNQELLAAVNGTGRALLSSTVLEGRTTLRLAVGNLRTTADRLAATLEVLDGAVGRVLESEPDGSRRGEPS